VVKTQDPIYLRHMLSHAKLRPEQVKSPCSILAMVITCTSEQSLALLCCSHLEPPGEKVSVFETADLLRVSAGSVLEEEAQVLLSQLSQ